MRIAQLIIISAMLLEACGKSKKVPEAQSTKIVVVHDLSATVQVQPLAEPVLALYNFAQNRDAEAAFDYVLLTNKPLTPVSSYLLRNRAELSGGATNSSDTNSVRNAMIEDFQREVKKIFARFPEQFRHQEGADQSRCFCTIMDQLRRLATNHCKRKMLIVFSDLTEMPSEIDATVPENRLALQQDPGSIGSMLSRNCPVPRHLQGITIIFVFKAQAHEQHARFMDMVAMYQTVLGKGARIYVRSDNSKIMNNESW